MIIDADCVDQDIGFFNKALDLAFCITAVVVSTVGK
jgi:hypothetical protein